MSARNRTTPPAQAPLPPTRMARRAILATATGALLISLGAHAALYEDVTTSVGIAQEEGLCYGSAWGDYDNDGDPDLCIAANRGFGGFDQPNFVYRNDGNGRFVRLGSEAGPLATDPRQSFGAACVDFDNDGHRDFLLINAFWNASGNDLYWNHGDGTFGRGEAGELTGRVAFRSWQACADYDGDGWVDVCLSAEGPTRGPQSPQLYHATGHGTFTRTELGPALAGLNACAWADYDNDGDPDLLLIYTKGECPLWRNEGQGRFTQVNAGLQAEGNAWHAAWADYDSDGDLDVAIATLSTPETLKDAVVYRNDNGTQFVTAVTMAEAYAYPSWADYDNDGHVDFLGVDGMKVARKAALYHNNGDGTFGRANDVFTDRPNDWSGAAWADYDNDGFMDLLLLRLRGCNRLYHNLGNANHWLKFKLTGTVSNRDAIGAKVRVLATVRGRAVWQMREVSSNSHSQDDPRPHFGLGDATKADRVIIEWPSGNRQEYVDLTADRIVAITELARRSAPRANPSTLR